MTISDELETLMQTKKNLKKAITNKGVSIPSGTPFAAYPDAINAISGEGGSFVDLSNYATKDYVDDAISNIELIPGPQGPQGEQGPAGKDADPVDLEGYATEDFVMEAIANIEVSGGGDVDLTGYVTEEELQNNALIYVGRDDVTSTKYSQTYVAGIIGQYIPAEIP